LRSGFGGAEGALVSAAGGGVWGVVVWVVGSWW
jgi:hypothetical protein